MEANRPQTTGAILKEPVRTGARWDQATPRAMENHEFDHIAHESKTWDDVAVNNLFGFYPQDFAGSRVTPKQFQSTGEKRRQNCWDVPGNPLFRMDHSVLLSHPVSCLPALPTCLSGNECLGPARLLPQCGP
jgi:hypothetical protein